VLAQSYQNWELLVSDNCSQDKTYEIAQSYAEKDKRVICWQNPTNVGVVRNYNQCIERSTGEYIELFASDDRFETTCLEKFVGALKANQTVVAITSARNLIDESGNCLKTDRPMAKTTLLSAEEVISGSLSTLSNWIISPVMFRAIFKEVGFDSRLGTYSDIDYWLRILRNGSLLYLDEVLFNYRVHAGSETTKIFKEMTFALDVLRMADRHADIITASDRAGKATDRIVMDRLIAMTNHAVNELKLSLASVLQHYSNASPSSAEQGRRVALSHEEVEQLFEDMHDYRRVASLALLRGIDLGRQLVEMEHEKNKAELRNGSLNGRIDELNEAIKALEIQQEKLLNKRDQAVQENNALQKRVEELKQQVGRLEQVNSATLVRCESAGKENENLVFRLGEATEQVRTLSTQLDALLNSQSWKITAPFRKVRKKLVGDHHR